MHATFSQVNIAYRDVCRAVRVLKSAHTIFAEDCRHSRKLLTHYGITTPLQSYHAHNEARRAVTIVELLDRGLPVALVSDAGCPGVSDPGANAVSAAIEAAHAVVPIPGPSAALAALTASGLPTNAFHFQGFLPPKSAARRKQLDALRTRVTVRYVSWHTFDQLFKSISRHLGRCGLSSCSLPRVLC